MALKLSKCRLCLKLGDFYSIFTEDDTVQLADMAMAIAKIKIADGDGLPDKICTECVAKLSGAFIFKQQCERSDQELRRNHVPPPGFARTPTPPPANRQSSDSGFSAKTELSVSTKPEFKDFRKRLREEHTNDTKTSTPVGSISKKSKIQPEPDTQSESDNDFDIPDHSTIAEDSDSNQPVVSDRNKCKQCNKIFPNVSALANHVATHKKTSSFAKIKESPSKSNVEMDEETLKTEALTKRLSVDLDKMHPCERCDRAFKLKVMLNRHMLQCKKPNEEMLEIKIDPAETNEIENQVTKPSVPCPTCDVMLYSVNDFTQHYRKCPNFKKDNKFICKPCRFPYKEWTFLKHLQDVHFKKRACSICSQQFNSDLEVNKHIASVHFLANQSQMDMSGDDDRSRASTADDARSEDSNTSSTRNYACTVCEKPFKYKKSLQSHMKILHGMEYTEPKVPPLTIKMGAKAIAAPSTPVYRPDEPTDDSDDENSDGDLTCDKCEKMFSYKRLLIHHKKTKHNGWGLSKSKYQPTSKRSKVQFNNCMAQCLLCDETFSTVAIVEHNKAHILKKQKPKNIYTCYDCNESMNSATGLRNHIHVAHGMNTSLPAYLGPKSEKTEEETMNPADFLEVVVAKEEPPDVDAAGNQRTPVIVQKYQKYNSYNKKKKGDDRKFEPSELTCRICGKVMETISSFRRHVAWCSHKASTITKLISCNVCGLQFRFKTHHRLHMKAHYQGMGMAPDSLKCKLCSKECINLRSLRAHMNWHKQQRFKTSGFECAVCKRVFEFRHVYLTHLRRHVKFGETIDQVQKTLDGEVKIQGNQCPRCEKVCDSHDSLKRHMAWHNSKSALYGQRYECEHCGKQFTNKGAHKLHEKTHWESEDGPFQCQICNKRFVSEIYFTKHVKAHNFDRAAENFKKSRAEKKSKRVQCPICPRTYPNLPKLIGHVKLMHPKNKMVKEDPDAPSEKKYSCKRCAQVFYTERRFLNHQQRHLTNNVRYVCKLCNKTNLSRKLHNVHIKTHIYIKKLTEPIQCFYCEDTFLSGRKLHDHIKDAHGINEQYIADTKKVDNAGPLREHQCHVCHKVLASRGNYVRHLIYHNLLKCNYCFEQFTAKIFVDGHTIYSCEKRKLVGYTNELPKKLVCELCYKPFNLQIKLDCHLKVKHNKDVTRSRGREEHSIACDYCFQVFEDEDLLNSHKIYHRTIGYYGCLYCTKKFNTVTAYNRHKVIHMTTYLDDCPQKCEHCEETFTKFPEFIYHMRDVHGDDKEWITEPKEVLSEECHLCKKVFHNLPRHMDYHEQNRCKKCGEYFFSQAKMDEHLCHIDSDDDDTATKLGIVEAYDECYFCFKQVTSRTRKVHGNQHSVSGAISCRLCHLKFKTVDSFYIHGVSHRSRKYRRKKLRCPDCDLKFSTYGPFVKHMRALHNKFHKLYYRAFGVPEECRVCHGQFPNLHNHYRAHLQHQCGECKKYFTSQKVFRAHKCGQEDIDPTKVFECSEDLNQLINEFVPKDKEMLISYYGDTEEEPEPEEPQALSSVVITSVHSLKPDVSDSANTPKPSSLENPNSSLGNIKTSSKKPKSAKVPLDVTITLLEDTPTEKPVNGIVGLECNESANDPAYETICLDSDED